MVKYGYQDKLFHNSGRIKGGIQNAAAAKEGIAGQSPGAVPPCRRHLTQSQSARRVFGAQELEELAGSIQALGLLQPLTVRRRADGWELVAGERRLRAAKLAGLEEVPCISLQIDDQRSSLLALVENLQRKDLDFWEEALALDRLISVYHLSQEEAARASARASPPWPTSCAC